MLSCMSYDSYEFLNSIIEIIEQFLPQFNNSELEIKFYSNILKRQDVVNKLEIDEFLREINLSINQNDAKKLAIFNRMINKISDLPKESLNVYDDENVDFSPREALYERDATDFENIEKELDSMPKGNYDDYVGEEAAIAHRRLLEIAHELNIYVDEIYNQLNFTNSRLGESDINDIIFTFQQEITTVASKQPISLSELPDRCDKISKDFDEISNLLIKKIHDNLKQEKKIFNRLFTRNKTNLHGKDKNHENLLISLRDKAAELENKFAALKRLDAELAMSVFTNSEQEPLEISLEHLQTLSHVFSEVQVILGEYQHKYPSEAATTMQSLFLEKFQDINYLLKNDEQQAASERIINLIGKFNTILNSHRECQDEIFIEKFNAVRDLLQEKFLSSNDSLKL